MQRLVTRLMRGDEATAVAARFVGRGLDIIVVLAGLVYALSSLEVRLGPLLGALGIGGLAPAFAAQSILENFFSSILLQARHMAIAGALDAAGITIPFPQRTLWFATTDDPSDRAEEPA